MSSATAGIHPVAKVFLVVGSPSRPFKADTNFSVPLILVVSNKGFLLLSAVSVTGEFDDIFERSAIGARGV